MFGKGLRDGWLRGHPVTVVPGGLSGVQEGLANLKNGKASATKYVFRIGETSGVKLRHRTRSLLAAVPPVEVELERVLSSLCEA